MKLCFCVICGTNKNLEHHHIKPVSRGGDDHQHNFITLCDEHHGMIHQIRPGAWNNRKKLVQIGREKALANGVKFGTRLLFKICNVPSEYMLSPSCPKFAGIVASDSNF